MMRIYDALGRPALERLVDIFYDRVAADPLLRPLFPQDFARSKRLLVLFLVETFGGPPEYSRLGGFARLIMAHHTQDFTWEERDAWVGHMYAAIDQVGIGAPWREMLRTWFDVNANVALERYRRGERRVPG